MNPAELLPHVYDELRKLAAAKLASEKPGHTLDATALVHEVFLKLGGERSFASRNDYLKAAAQAMRWILVDHARAETPSSEEAGAASILKPSNWLQRRKIPRSKHSILPSHGWRSTSQNLLSSSSYDISAA